MCKFPLDLGFRSEEDYASLLRARWLDGKIPDGMAAGDPRLTVQIVDVWPISSRGLKRGYSRLRGFSAVCQCRRVTEPTAAAVPGPVAMRPGSAIAQAEATLSNL